ncbi:Asp23/Gls24 family envelope stress response protein [Nocardia farcinica]|uniref:Asp23/Gls24 family envelope stress response protein n=1 Tax=Nocardia farcinica TaxID=37329 RepID=UPI001893820A|nr:Asp23/Gls24 family envelope stress response protein [Nocardia farcinica]MBF6387281.1 Asp23/Gls24 family envelope stress response protein [Nocardia farcinica]
MTAVTAAADPVDPAADLPGVTVVADRVVRKIAARAAREVEGVEPDVDVAVRVLGDRASLDVRLAVGYPRPVGRTSDSCRAHLIRRTGELTGLTVDRVDIVVNRLVRPAETAGRVR